MANFSVNQVRHLYVAKACNTSITVEDETASATQSALSNVGDLQVKKTIDDEMYFLYQGPGGVLRSDLIPVKNITYAKAIDAAKLATKMRKISITLNSTYLDSGNTIAGQDYVLGINFKNFFAAGDDSQYYKDTAVHSSGQSASNFYKAMVVALNNAFSREDGATATTNPYLKFKIGYSSSSEMEVGDANWDTTTATKLIIEEKPQEWALGTKKARRIMFDVFPSTIYDGTEDVIWATQNVTTGNYYTEETPSTTVGDGQKIADLEWFSLGERGDQYRNVGWPNVIPTEYVADSTQEYHTIELHYFFTDSGVNSYKTEKEITLAVPKGSAGHVYDVVNNIGAAINFFADSTIVNTLSA